MASKRAFVPAKHLFANFRATQHPACQQIRAMATEAPISTTSTHAAPPAPTSTSDSPRPVAGSIPNPFLVPATCTLYTFPSLAPSGLTTYPSTHLLLPTRRDILHRAVIYEADGARQGTANTKHRSEVHGSGKKIRPQKGTGSARLGDKKSPMLRGGGVAFGPKPRDHSTDLPKKEYDLAFRTALSVRYRRGELIVVEGVLEVDGVSSWSMERYSSDILRWNGLEGSLFVTLEAETAYKGGFFGALEDTREARGIWVEECHVKDLLSGKRLCVERKALEKLLREHQEDLAPRLKIKQWGENLLEEVDGARV